MKMRKEVLSKRLNREAGRHVVNANPDYRMATLQMLGVAPSFSRPKVSDDNPYSESLFKTLKYCPGYPEYGFADIEGARIWVGEFVHSCFLSRKSFEPIQN
ncbi:MAG: hypothetical protein HZA03_04965 [Nitrospinae bacterium]|nr:hypothetical protein [Nitrospinota bacterium]